MEIIEEKYRKIDLVPNYGISKKGDVINIKTGFKLKSNVGIHGYKRIVLRNNDKKKITKSIHRLVALTWIPNPDNKETVNHIDGNKLNNKVTNLEWNTVQENTIHSYENDLNSLSVGVKVYDRLKKITTTYRSIQYLSILLKVDDKLLLPYIKNSINYPFMGRYEITIINENRIIENLNSKNFGIPVYVYDIINDTINYYSSLGVAAYYTSLRSISKLSKNTLESVGYIISKDSITIKPISIIPIETLKENRKKYLSRPYSPLYIKYAVIDMVKNDNKVITFENIEEFSKFIYTNHKLHISKLSITNIKLKPNYNSRLFLGYNIQQYNIISDLKPWNIFSEEQILNSRNGYRSNTPVYKVSINGSSIVYIFTTYRLLSYLKHYIRDNDIFIIDLNNITIERILNSIDKKHNIIINKAQKLKI